MNLYFLRYNNYFNRQVKIENTLEDYLTYQVGEVLGCKNWNPNDGVNTEQVLNYVGDAPDYMVVGDNDGNLDSRWFVIDANRTRNGQYKVTLRRDLVAEHYSAIMNATSYVEKGFVDGNDAAVFNPENIAVNQIKTGQDLLYDRSGCPWIVGFVKKGGSDSDTPSNERRIDIPTSLSDYRIPDFSVNRLSELPIFNRNIAYKSSVDYVYKMWGNRVGSLGWKGCTVPNCIGYVTGVWMDMVRYLQPGGSNTHPCPYIGNAGYWWTQAGVFTLADIMADSSIIEAGDILCFQKDNDPAAGTPDAWGHLAIIETLVDVDDPDGYIETTNSYYGGAMFNKVNYYRSDNFGFPGYTCQGIIKKPAGYTYSGAYSAFSTSEQFSNYVKADSFRKSCFTNNAYTGGISTTIAIQTTDPPADGYAYYESHLPEDADSTSDIEVITYYTNPAVDVGVELLPDSEYTNHMQEVKEAMLSGLSTYNSIELYNTLMTQENAEYFYNTYNNKIVYEESTGKKYQITFTTQTDRRDTFITQDSSVGDIERLFQLMTSDLLSAGNGDATAGFPNRNTFRYNIDIVKFVPSYTVITHGNYINMIDSELEDAPYSMFFLPLGALPIYSSTNTYRFTSNKALSLAISRALSSSLSQTILDLVVLPYCPVQSCIYVDKLGNPYLNETGLNKADIYSYADVPFMAIYFAKKSEFEFDISYITNIAKTDYKVDDICKKYRLSSSNNANYFEFSPAKNHNVTKFSAHCTYKPFQPYVRIEPNFKYLYGNQYRDGRGLILSGDFSLPRTENAWNDYLIQNKYYKDIFDRGTQNLETNEHYNRIERGIGVVTNALSTGVMAGMLSGGLGVAAGGISLGAGIADMYIADKRYEEAKDYRQDLFQLNLQNIQALPEGLVKGNGWNIDSTYVPFVEIYECTAEERTAVVNKLKWNGYTVGRIGTFNTYRNTDDETYVKGQIIRIENVPDDFHYVNEISNEMYKGVFIPAST